MSLATYNFLTLFHESLHKRAGTHGGKNADFDKGVFHPNGDFGYDSKLGATDQYKAAYNTILKPYSMFDILCDMDSKAGKAIDNFPYDK